MLNKNKDVNDNEISQGKKLTEKEQDLERVMTELDRIKQFENERNYDLEII